MQTIQPGDRIHGFTLVSVSDQEEYKGKGYTYRHDKTGLELFHLHNDDTENLFSFTFKTPAFDNTGVAHILEHSVLSGSGKYPVKDPFMALMKGSMNTFLNAMTYPEKTVYPAASPVEKDYFNMMSVYADAVFFPLLKKEVFHQEGHRLEFDEDGNLKIVGIVFNEMKGAYSDHDSIVGEWCFRSLFPDTQYHYDSGGQPEAIPDLSYEEFINYHETYYHPSNCRVFLYGDIPSEKQLGFLEDGFLNSFVKKSVDTEIENQIRWDNPRSLEFTSPLTDDEDPKGKSTIAVNWLMNDIGNPLDLLSLEVLSDILLSNSGSPLYKAIVDSGLGADISPVSGLETDVRELIFSVGIRGTDPDKKKAFEKLLEDELIKLVEKGLLPDIVEGALKRVEFRNREIKGGAPFGLKLMGKTLRGWLHGYSPETTLEFSRWMEELKEKVAADNTYFEKLIKQIFLDNNHRVTVLVRPDAAHTRKQEETLDLRVKEITSTMDAGEEAIVRKENKDLRLFQDTPDSEEDTAKIPSLSMDDLPLDITYIDTKVSNIGNIPIYTHDLFTNGIDYVDYSFDIPGLSEEERMYLPLFVKMITTASLPDIPYNEVARILTLITGGFGSFLESSVIHPDRKMLKDLAFFRVKFLESDYKKALDFVLRMFKESMLSEEKRLKDVLVEMKNDYSAAVIPSGNAFAALRAGSRLSETLRREEQWRGVDQLLFLSKISEDTDPHSLKNIGIILEGIRGKVLTGNMLSVNITASGAELTKLYSYLEEILDDFPVGDAAGADPEICIGPEFREQEALVIPSPVSYVAQVFRSSLIESKEYGSEILLSHILRTDYLWENVRMKGGAYGASASANGMEGVFSFSSYRDPNIEKTIDAFRKGLELLADEGVSKDILEKAIITIVGRDVRPQSPGEKSIIGFIRKLYNITDDIRKIRRKSIMEAGSSSLKAAAGRLLKGMSESAIVVMAGKEGLEKAAGSIKGLMDNSINLPH
ncbi:MAG: insulinase family protein [Spirochaetales bacterium]|nr:insulinase family protein [Spirochaetales bacterium]